MFTTEFITSLLKRFEDRLENCTQCGSCLAGIVAVVEFTIAEAKGLKASLAEVNGQGRAKTGRAFAVRGSLKTIKPWEKIHV